MVAFLFNAPLFARPLLLVTCSAWARSDTRQSERFRSHAGARSQPRCDAAVLYPITIRYIAGVRGTSALLATPPDEPMATFWMRCSVFSTRVVTLSL